jgi:hypothetical protein
VTHPRKTIRDAAVELLEGTSIVASGKVFANRALEVAAEDLPVLNVYAEEEAAAFAETAGFFRYRRSVELVVHAQAMAAEESTLDDTLDDLAEQIETAMAAGLPDPAVEVLLANTTIEHTTDGQQPIGHVRLTYRVLYVS